MKLNVAHRLFSQKLLQWHTDDNNRQLPWKEEKNPYKIWLSEIMLQQTRADQVIPYFLKFITNYPTIIHLADAPEQEVFALWQGLGYYSRCRNLIKTAKLISSQYNGQFPKAFENIISLPGIGHYTASAIASFAFHLPHAVVDGNVYRVLSRYFADATPIDTTLGIKHFRTLAQQILPEKQAALYNQAIMDFGANICNPKKPQCVNCPLNESCQSYLLDKVELFPLKTKKIKLKNRYFHYFFIRHKDEIYIQERVEKDIWQGLYEFYLVESENEEFLNTKQTMPAQLRQAKFFKSYQQKLTHQRINIKFYLIKVDSLKDIKNIKGRWIKYYDFVKFGFPKTIVSFFNDYEYI